MPFELSLIDLVSPYVLQGDTFGQWHAVLSILRIATGDWVLLGSPVGAFSVIRDMLQQGGLGRIQDIWPGPPAADTSVLAAQPEVADPDGSQGSTLFTTLAGMLNEAGT